METTHELNQMKEKFKDIKRYKTSDIGLAATLVVLGKDLLYIEPLKTDAPKGDFYHFIFEKSDDIDELVLKYSTNSPELSVVPNSFRSTMRYLKIKTKNTNR